MKICITSQGESLDSPVDPRFGRCQYFIVVDTETLGLEAIQNPNIDSMGGVGVQSGQLIATWDPHAHPIITEVKGNVNSEDLIQEVTVQVEKNQITGVTERVVVEHKPEHHPQIIITDNKSEVV